MRNASTDCTQHLAPASFAKRTERRLFNNGALPSASALETISGADGHQLAIIRTGAAVSTARQYRISPTPPQTPHPCANPNRHLMSTDALQIQQVLRVVAIRLMARHCSSAPSLGRSCGGRRGDPRAAIPRILIRARANTCASQALKILMRGVIVSRARSSAESSKVPLAAIFPGCVGRR
jgi:hypothetical protein